ncbi:cytochrome c, partial [Candidatus Sumerlaeota bacterium]|nr:cytochrome c [Candidatus Sumerlaeota bacterium]
MSLEIRRVVRAAFLITSLTGNAGVWAAEGSSPPASPTFAGDIAPIIYTKCVSCHRPGEIAPMSFTSYEETRPWAKSIRKSVSERKMPPWKAEPGIGGPWLHDPSLSQEEIDTIARWVDQGAPAGDLAK